MFTRIGCAERPPHFHVEFYPTAVSSSPFAAVAILSLSASPIFFFARRLTFWKVLPLFYSPVFIGAARHVHS